MMHVCSIELTYYNNINNIKIKNLINNSGFEKGDKLIIIKKKKYKIIIIMS